MHVFVHKITFSTISPSVKEIIPETSGNYYRSTKSVFSLFSSFCLIYAINYDKELSTYEFVSLTLTLTYY